MSARPSTDGRTDTERQAAVAAMSVADRAARLGPTPRTGAEPRHIPGRLQPGCEHTYEQHVCGSCDLCGTSVVLAHGVRDANGARHEVCSDCLRRIWT